MSALWDPLFARGDVAATTSDDAWVRAMLAVEVALAHAMADVGIGSAADALILAEVAAALRPDPGELGAAAAGPGNPVPALARALTAAVAHASPDAAESVHRGATSQDVVDTALMLLARDAVAVIVADLRTAADATAALARTHADSPIVGRTLLQHAVPTTFGLVAAGWMVALDAAADALDAWRPAAQLGGASGSLDSLHPHGPAVLDAFAARLGLTAPVLPWHTDRGPVVELAGLLGRVAAAVGTPAGDLVLLAQTEVAEVRVGAGGSSTMPHKRNPTPAVAARACALQAPGPIATLCTTAVLPEHQRAAGAWHAEWRPLVELLRVVGSAASWLVEALDVLDVDTAAMRATLERAGGVVVTERVVTALTPSLGRLAAADLVAAAVAAARPDGADLAERIAERVALPDAEVTRLLDPTRDTGAARMLVNRALQARGSAHG